MTTEVARRGYVFAQVRPRGERDPATHTVRIAYVVDEGPRVYIERINVRGNTRTRDYVIRREFEIGEGDAYNRVLIDRAERRLNSLGYFKKVRITNEPGSAPDRVVVNVDVEDQPTGAFSVVRRLLDGGRLHRRSFGQRDRTSWAAASSSASRRSSASTRRGVEFSFTEPYFLGPPRGRLRPVLEVQRPDPVLPATRTGRPAASCASGLPITEEIAVTLRYSLYQQDWRSRTLSRSRSTTATLPIPGTRPSTQTARRYTESAAKATAKRRSRSRSRRARR